MDIRQLSPQTQRTLSKMDFNRDQQLSTRELELIKNIPSVQGIAPKDLALIQEALKKSKGPEQIIVKLVEDDLPPGYTKPEPIFREKPAKPAPPNTQANPQVRAQPDKPAAKKGAGKAVEQPPVTFKATAKTTAKPGSKPGEPNTQTPTGADFQTTARFGAVQLQGTTSVSDEGRALGGRMSASYQPADNLGVEVGVEGAPGEAAEKSKTPAKTGTRPAGSTKTSKPAPAPVSSAPTTTQLPENLSLNGKINAGPIKLGAKAKLNPDGSPLQNLSTSAEVKVVPGHALRAEAKPVAGNNGNVSWGSVKLGTSHQVYTGLSLTTTTQLGEAGKPNKYGGGFSYDYGNGLNLEGEALTRADTTFTRPAQTLQSLDVKFGFRYKREF